VATELGHATEPTTRPCAPWTAAFLCWKRFGHSVAAAKSEQLFEGGLRLDGKLRAVAVLGARGRTWMPPQEPGACGALGDLESFYEVVQDSVDKAHALLQAAKAGCWPCGGRPWSMSRRCWSAGCGLELKAHLKVWASQQFLRGGSALQWAWRLPAARRPWLVGPKGRQRYAVLGVLSAKCAAWPSAEAGAWLDERSAARPKRPLRSRSRTRCPAYRGARAGTAFGD